MPYLQCLTDAASTIRELRTSGVKVAVSSNNFQELVDDYIARTGIEFDMVLGYRDNFAKGEDHFRHIETTCGIARDEMTFVGDSLKDGEKAAASGVTFRPLTLPPAAGALGWTDASDTFVA